MQPRVHPYDKQPNRDNDRPQFDIQNVNIEPREHGTDHGSDNQGVEQVAAGAVVLPHLLGILDSAKHTGDPPHQEPDEVLRQQHKARGDAQVPMDAVEVRVGPLLDFVGLDDEHARAEEEEAQQVERGVQTGADFLLVGGPGRLEDQDGLGQSENAGGLEEGVRTEEGYQGRIAEDGGPDKGDKEEGAELSEPAGS